MIEDKRNRLNLELRSILAIIDMIDGVERKYPNYIENTMTEDDFLEQQLMLAVETKDRLINIFKD